MKKESEIEELIDNMYPLEMYDELNQEMCPENALTQTFWDIIGLLPNWINAETKIESNYYDTVWEFMRESYSNNMFCTARYVWEI